MTNNVYTLDEIKKLVTPIAKEYGADKVYLFGSYARGEATPDSDLDFRVDKGKIRGLSFAGFYCALEEAFGKQIDVVTTASIDDSFKTRIAPEEVLLYA